MNIWIWFHLGFFKAKEKRYPIWTKVGPHAESLNSGVFIGLVTGV